MKSVERRIEPVNGLSSFTLFCRAIKGQNYSNDRLLRQFKKLVDPKDYTGVPKTQVLRHLKKFNNTL